jgi:hypothetical protein
MGFWTFLNRWWNLPYLVMLGLVGVFFLLQAVGYAAHGDSELDHDVDHDIEHDCDADHDHEVDHDVDGEDGEPQGSILGAVRVPFMVVWLTSFIFAGFTGIFVNRVLQVKTGGYAPWFFPLSLVAALGAGGAAVRFVSRGVAKLVDTGGRGAPRRREFSGAVGVVASATLDASFGEVRVMDARGNELIVHGRLEAGEAPLAQGAKVVLLELDVGTGLFHVARLD